MRTGRWLGQERVRLAVLCLILVCLAAYAATTRLGIIGGTGSGAAAACGPSEAPSVMTVGPSQLLALRRELKRLVAFDPRLHPYEEGPISSSSAWTDAEPGAPRAQPLRGPQPGGFELRWWMPTLDDVVVDGFIFADTEQARDFFERASSTGCRSASTAQATDIPPGGRNLAWLNPDNAAQEDVLLLRGLRVYRVSVVLVGGGHRPTLADRRSGFPLVNRLACALPDAGCLGTPGGERESAA